MLIEGNGLKRDVKNGVKWLQMAAEQGDAGAMLIMGDLHRKGVGVAKNINMAVEYFILADENGNKNAAKRLQKLTLKEALPWWEKKAEAGDKAAVLKLLAAYSSGDGIPKDMDKAKKLFVVANESWAKDAAAAVSTCSAEQKAALQLAWLEKKAENGDKDASLKLMLALATGDGIPEDMSKAKNLYEVANKKWPKDTEKALATLSEEKKNELTYKPKPVASGSASGIKPVSSSGGYLRPYSASRIAPEKCIVGTESEIKSKYLSLLKLADEKLKYYYDNLHSDPWCGVESAWCYAMAELCRLTLLSEYRWSARDVAAIDGIYRASLYDSIQGLIQIAKTLPNDEAGDILCIICFLTEGYGGQSNNTLQMKAISRVCCMNLVIACRRMELIRDDRTTDYINAVLQVGGMLKDSGVLLNIKGVYWIQQFVLSAKPELKAAISAELYESEIKKIMDLSEQCKRAPSYRVSIVKDVIDKVSSAVISLKW